MPVLSLREMKEAILEMPVGEEGDFFLAAETWLNQEKASRLAFEINQERGVGHAWITPTNGGVCDPPITIVHVRISH